MLESFPEGSLGRGYFDFVTRDQFSFPGQKGPAPSRSPSMTACTFWLWHRTVSESDPDARILKMLGGRGSHVAAESEAKDGKTAIPPAKRVRAGGLATPKGTERTRTAKRFRAAERRA